jgi:LmbE family N-acetylglucosaminyl deacetylase
MLTLAAFLLFQSQVGLARAPGLPTALQPATSGGLPVVERGLTELTNSRRLLLIGAHPDDESNDLLTVVSRDMGVDTAYMSLSRGEGGQNLIGPELGQGLGLLRTGELLAARRVDGARQYFSRACDFGYTRSLEETLGFWPHQALLKDVVRIIRRVRPQVLISVFPSGGGGHGQHKAAGLVAHEAFDLAGDPSAFPELESEEGLKPWQPLALYREGWTDPAKATLRLSLDDLDPITGRSMSQLGVESRDQHRSQGEGRVEPPGSQSTSLIFEKGAPGIDGRALFGGMDTSLEALANGLKDAALKASVIERLRAVESTAGETLDNLTPANLDSAVPQLLTIVRTLGEVEGDLESWDDPGASTAGAALQRKLDSAELALAAAAGVVVDATTDREDLVPGTGVKVEARVWNAGTHDLDLPPAGLRLQLPSGWRNATASFHGQAVGTGSMADWTSRLDVPADAPISMPYFLRHPKNGWMYDWSAAPPALRGQPLDPPLLMLEVRGTLDGVPIELEREVVAVHGDRVQGEVRRPLRVVPALEVSVEPQMLVWPTGSSASRDLALVVRSHADSSLRGVLSVKPPAGWPAPVDQSIEVRAGEEQSAEVELSPASDGASTQGQYEVSVTLPDGRRFAAAVPLVDYPHIRPSPDPVPATVALSSFPLKLPNLARMGYVPGPADPFPEFLAQVGLPIELLDAKALLESDLSRYPVIVVGSRAYEVDEALQRANGRLLDYARAGGTLIVLYQKYPFIRGGYAPYPLTIAHPHDRITDETAPVRILDDANPIFHVPNEIGPSDWQGWVQERGLYFAHTWDPAYKPLLAMQDPGQPEQKGGLLIANLGEGRYVYTGIAFFRQLPAGVPGGWRLFANLLALGTSGAGPQ